MTNNLNNTIIKTNICQNGHRPEIQLLLCCSQPHIDLETTEGIKTLLNENINWEYLFQIADQHRIKPLLYHRLRAICRDSIPENLFTQLKNYFYVNAIRNQRLANELNNILNLFESNGISAIPFKGPVLAVSVYNHLSLRQFGDLDILIRKQDMLKAQKLLVSQGYVLQRAGKEQHLTEINHNIWLNSQHRYDEWYWKTLDQKSLFGARVELHWETTPKHIIFPLNPKKLWNNLKPVFISNMVFSSLPFEDLLPVLCLNYAKDHWTQLKMICDIAEIVHNTQNLDWKKVIDHANSLRRKRTLFLGLFLAHDVLKAELPPEIWQQMQTDLVAKALAKQVCERLFINQGYDPGIVEKTWYNLRLRENLLDKANYLVFSFLKVFEQDKKIFSTIKG